MATPSTHKLKVIIPGSNLVNSRVAVPDRNTQQLISSADLGTVHKSEKQAHIAIPLANSKHKSLIGTAEADLLPS